MTNRLYPVFSIDPNGPWSGDLGQYLFTTIRDRDTVEAFWSNEIKTGDLVIMFQPNEVPDAYRNEYGWGSFATIHEWKDLMYGNEAWIVVYLEPILE